MNKKDLAKKIARKFRPTFGLMTIQLAEEIIDELLGLISNSLENGEKVRLVGFGNFVVRKRKGRIGRNPQTGERMDIKESLAPAFAPGYNLKNLIKNKEIK